MIDDYKLQEILNNLSVNAGTLNDLTKTNIMNSLYLNCSEEQKSKVTEAFVEGVCIRLRNGTTIMDDEIIKKLIKEDLINININKLSSLIKDSIEIKLEKIFKEMETNYSYADMYNTLKNTLNPIIKKKVQEICASNDKSIINNTLHAVTMASAFVSIKDHAEKLFKKAQNIVNEEIIKEIIE
jgi:hypothetical protein